MFTCSSAYAATSVDAERESLWKGSGGYFKLAKWTGQAASLKLFQRHGGTPFKQ